MMHLAKHTGFRKILNLVQIIFIVFTIFVSSILIFSSNASAQTIFNQTIVLQNQNFDADLNSWTNISELGTPEFYWINSDVEQLGIAQIFASGVVSNFTGSLYQSFNLSIPDGTIIENLTFSTMWKIYEFDGVYPARIYFSIANNTNFTTCNYFNESLGTTSWNVATLNTNGSDNCFIQNFTSNTFYNIRFRCELTTDTGVLNESCFFDNVTARVFYSDVELPSINFVNVSPLTVNFTNPINFTANISDNLQIDDVWISIYGINHTMNFLDGIYYFDLFNTTIYTQNYDYIIYVNDTSGLSSNYTGNFSINDTASPFIFLNFPVYNHTFSPGIITLNYTPSDFNLNNCSLYTNTSGVWEINQTNTTPVNSSSNYFNLDLSYGSYLWNINCCDIFENCGFNSTTRVFHVASDLEIIEGDVSLSNLYPIHGEQVIVFATLRNLDDITLNDVLVSFYDGDPEFNGALINITYVNFTPFEVLTINTSWVALRGVHELYAVININRTTIEINYSNNYMFNTTYTLSWHTYYGNTTAVMTSVGSAASPAGSSLLNWSIGEVSIVQANIYVVDSVATVSWDSLQALSRDVSNQSNSNTINDYAELDFCLNSTLYPDSINYTYNNATTIFSTYEVYSRTISNVPDAQSTNNTNFYTGVFWDTSIGYDYYNCSINKVLRPNIVFATKINDNQEGKYGLYDYEIRIPEELGNYKGSTNKVSLYYELI